MRAIIGAIVASVALVGTYLGLGGADYKPAEVADPCAMRDWREPDGFQEVAEQIVLSGLDGAACELGVTREEMVLALGSAASREEFAREHELTEDELVELVREGAERAIDDAVEADALNSTIAQVIRTIIARIPIDELIGSLDELLPSF